MISIDTETTGIDLHHGAAPFFVTVCKEDGEQLWWEWEVDPLTRKVAVLKEDLLKIKRLVDEADCIVGQNIKFDVAGLRVAGMSNSWPWYKTYDTLLAGHLLASNQPHDLTSMVLQYLGRDISACETKLKEACVEARKIAGKEFPDWHVASADLLDMPGVGEKSWRYDFWLPKTVARELAGRSTVVPTQWYKLLEDYSNTDSAATLMLWRVQEVEIKRRRLWDIYLHRLKLLPIVYSMEARGITINRTRLEELKKRYAVESDKAARVCVDIAKGYDYDLKLPKSGNNKSLLEFCFGRKQDSRAACRFLDLPIVEWTDTRRPSLNKAAIDQYKATLPECSKQLVFINSLSDKRGRDTAIQYMEGYKRFWLPLNGTKSWCRLHPSVNPTGTDTLRWSNANPNGQNISKREGFNLRYCFGPAPGREWWSLDAKNLELRIPAYESGEQEMVDLFDRMDEPPYYGSYHLLIFDILHPEKFAKDGARCKEVYESTWYQWTKNGNFAVTYGAVEQSGTANRAYHVPGAQRLIKGRLKSMTKLAEKYVQLANKYGYVETLPDKTVDPKRGYPLICSRSEYGKILLTVPFNYHVQGTAMWWMGKAMIRCQEQLDKWKHKNSFDGFITLQVHDELVFDFPKGSNLYRIRILQKLMEQCGDDINVPTPVSVEYYNDNWSIGKVI